MRGLSVYAEAFAVELTRSMEPGTLNTERLTLNVKIVLSCLFPQNFVICIILTPRLELMRFGVPLGPLKMPYLLKLLKINDLVVYLYFRWQYY